MHTSTIIHGLDVLLASRSLVGAEVELVDMDDRERRLRKGLKSDVTTISSF